MSKYERLFDTLKSKQYTPARTKISSFEINIFGFKNDGEKWSGCYFEIHQAL